MNLFKRMKIRTFLILFILGFTIFPIIIFTFFSFHHTKNTIQNVYNQNYVISMFSEIRSDLSLMLSQANTFNLQLNSSDELIQILNNSNTKEEERLSLHELISFYAETQTTFSYVDYIAPDDTLVSINHTNAFAPLLDQNYLTGLKRSKFTLYEFPVEIENAYYCVLGKQLYNYQKGYALGTLLLYVDQQFLSSVYENSDFDTFFISLNDRILSHTTKEYIGSVLYFPESTVSNGNLYSFTDSYSYYKDEFTHASLTNKLQLSALLSNKALLQPLHKIMTYIFISLIVIIFFTIIFVIFISRKLMQSFTNL